ncbi:MAG: amidophosphoribosyltransferase [Fidelibacterota bacterium]
MCGVVGIISHRPVAAELYESLIHLQHRGQDAAGIMTYDTRFHSKKGVGLVRDIFDEANMLRLQGTVGVGHTRYPTSGGFSMEEAQPFWTGVPYGIAMAHNGNIVNHGDLVVKLAQEHQRYVNSTSDTEAVMHLFAHALDDSASSDDGGDFFEHVCRATKTVFNETSGSYSTVAMIIGKGMVVFRDPHGIRPLARGERENPDGTIDFIFASETTMFYALGFKIRGHVAPGQVVFISEDGSYHSRILAEAQFTPCVFEYVYFARPDTMMNDVSVYRARLRMGQNLARKWKERFPGVLPDIVIPAPSTANTAALSFANELGVRYSEGLYKNPFIGRTFIMPGQEERKRSVRYKLVPQETEIKDKTVLIVDDSIVRGNTSKEIVKMVREFGATEIYFASTCPPIRNPCFYGVDMPTRSELIAHRMSEDEIQAHIGADKLLYQTLEDLQEAVTRKGKHDIDRPCMACLDGWYVTGDVDEAKMVEMEEKRNRERNNT